MNKPAEKNKKDKGYFDVAYKDCKGIKRFVIRHPARKFEIRVAAPTPEAAIVAAADYWGEAWTKYSFYAFCEVSPG